MDAVEGVFEQMAGADQREAQIIFTFGPECGAGNRGDAGFFQQDALNFFGGQPGVFDVGPGVERAFGRVAAKAGNFAQ